MVGGPEHGGEDDLGHDFHGEVEVQKRWAAGVPGVVKSLQHGVGKMGVRRTIATLRILNQPDGFDCPGCAWPEPDKAHHAEFCENGVKAVAEEATTGRITRDFFAAHPLDDLRQREEHWLGQQGRLTEPMVVRAGGTHYEPIAWDAAFRMIAEELHGLDAPDEASFYTSGRTSNEAAFLLQLFARAFGTNNLPDCSNMCHESTSLALGEMIGVGKGSVHITDFEVADLIVVVGQNPGTNHPRMLSTLEAAKRHGATIVAINSLAEPGLMRFKNPQKPRGLAGNGTAMADDHLQIRINGDLAFFKAVNHLLLADGDEHIDRAFIDEFTAGFDEVASDARDFDWAAFTAATGFERSVAERFADRVRRSERIIVCWAMGLTQHANSVDTIREVVNFLLLRGNTPPRRRSLPRARPLQRAGRPDDGDLREARAGVPGRARRRVRLLAAAPRRVRHGRDGAGDARRTGQGVRRHGRQFRLVRTRHCGNAPRAAALPAHRSDLHQAQRLAHDHRRTRP